MPQKLTTEAGRALIAEYGVRPESRFAQAVKDIEEQAVADFNRRLSEAEGVLNRTGATVEVLQSLRRDVDVDRLWRALEGIGVIANGTWVSFQREDAEKIAAAYREQR